MLFDEFLRQVAPSLGLQWRPFKRRGIKRRIEHRITEIGFTDLEAYLLRISEDRAEREHLSKLLTVTISRFFRDRAVFDALEISILPSLLKQERKKDLRLWSIGCASGEEPYSVSILWEDRFAKTWAQIGFSILASDVDEKLLNRAKEGIYKKSSLKEVPEDILRIYFQRVDGAYILAPRVREKVEFRRHDIIHEKLFHEIADVVFCRNLAFTYFSKEAQVDVLKKIAESLPEEGYLVIGKDESIPFTHPTLFVPVFPNEKIYRKFK